MYPTFRMCDANEDFSRNFNESVFSGWNDLEKAVFRSEFNVTMHCKFCQEQREIS